MLKTFMDDMNSEDVNRNCHDVLGNQDNLKTQKNLQKIA